MRAILFLVLAFLTSGAAPSDPIPAKRIALSFDDAPRGDGPMFTGDERGAVLLEALTEAETGPVVFFVTTRNIDEPGRRERIERYATAGHLMANHSHTHPWASRTEVEAYLADIDSAAAHIEGVENWRPWFRYPYLDEGRSLEKRDALEAGLAARGLMNAYVTVDNYDWYIEQHWQRAVNAERTVDLEALKGVYVDMLMGAVRFYDDAAVEALGRSPAHVLLLHENDVGALFIDDLVAALRAEGWEIISPDEAYEDPIAQMIPTTLRTGQGRVGALAIDAGRDPRTMTHLAIEEAQIDALIEDRGVFGPAPAEDE